MTNDFSDVTTCCFCDELLDRNGDCPDSACMVSPYHKKWVVPAKTSLLTKVKAFILGILGT